ncbi:MAG: DEAD/DEAH box helicase [Candidatus Micrarchaeota archaeon]|nr:DEAD/DEAH box helicase [Candidatus Micrarchaeota archaeon]
MIPISDIYSLFLSRYNEFTEIQRLALPSVEKGGNCLIIAPTGSGKTEASVLPVIKRILEGGAKEGVLALYITPLRALNRDLIKRLGWLADGAGVSMGVRHGDTSQKERREQALRPPMFMITTPETLQNLFMSPALRSALGNLRFVIVDEVHELYSNKRGAQLSIALERLEELSGQFQRIGLSATVGDVGEVSKFLFAGRGSQVIDTGKAKEFHVQIEMPIAARAQNKEFTDKFNLDSMAFARISRLADIIRDSNATLVFANTRQVVESLGNKLIYLDKIAPFGSVGIHHSSIDKAERVETENAFREGRVKSLLATSSLELGIDIGKIDVVVQYGSPRQVIRLMQRVGRAGHKELAISKGSILASDFLECLESMAILSAAKGLELEKHRMEKLALDVLANQICSIVLEYKTIGIDALAGIILRAAPYKELEASKLNEIVSLLAELGLVKFDGKELALGRRSRNYFIENISVIPDTKRLLVRTVVENRIIASLDESFVYSSLDVGSTFITKGLLWRVVSVDEGTVYVEPTEEEDEAAIPDWEGEDIPVSYNVARRVYLLFDKGIGDAGAFTEPATLKAVQEFMDRQRAFFMPSSDTIFVEELDDYTIAYIGLGKLANEFLARVINALVIPVVGSVVRVKATPYSIIIDYGGAAKRANMSQIFEALAGFKYKNELSIISGSELYRYKFVQVAKVFGIVEKEATVTRSMANRLISFYSSGVVNDEVLRDLNKNYFDMARVSRFLEDLENGTLKVKIVRRSGSPFSAQILESAYHHSELLQGVVGEKEIAQMLSKFEGMQVQLLCTFCGQVFSQKIEMASEAKLHCPVCKSSMLVTFEVDYEKVVRKRLEGKKLLFADQRTYASMHKEASLIQAYGNRALVALKTYGIGLDTAARILKLIRADYKTFFLDVIRAQKVFIKNRKFWKAG